MSLYPFDDAYVARLRAGDPFTQKHFHDYFDRRLKGKLYHRGVRSRSDIEDLVQEVFLRAWRKILSPDGIRDGRTLGSFMNSVCNNVFHEWLRRKTPDSLDEEHEQLPDPDDDPFEALARKEKRERVMRVLDGLSAKDQQLLRAVYLEGRDKDEVCPQFSVDSNYLRVLLYRARASFKGDWESDARRNEKGQRKDAEKDDEQGDETDDE